MAGDLDCVRDLPLKKMIACAERELQMRRHAYPKWVAAGRMGAAAAETEIATMGLIVEFLRGHSLEAVIEDCRAAAAQAQGSLL